MTGPHSPFHRYAAIIGRIKRLLLREWEVASQHLLREGNAAVDFMTKHGASSLQSLTVWEGPPPSIDRVLLADRLGTMFLRQ